MIKYCNYFYSQKHVQILSILDFVGGLVFLGLVCDAFYPALSYIWNVEIVLDYLVSFILAFGTILSQVILAVVLFFGAWKRQRSYLRIWIPLSALLLILISIIVIVYLTTEHHRDYDAISYTLLIGTIFKVYQIIIASGFMIRELQDGEGGGPALLFKKVDTIPI